MKEKITFLFAGVFTAGCLYYVFRDVDLRELLNSILSVNPASAALSVALFYLSMYLRALRWGWLFRPNHNIPGKRLFRPLMICFAFNSILPGRVGEFVRAFYVGKKERTGVPAAMATVVSERIFDGVTLLGFLAIALFMLPPIDPEAQVKFGKFIVRGAQIQPLIQDIIIMCVILIAGVAALMTPQIQRWIVRILEGLPLVPRRMSKRLVTIQQGVVKGFESIRTLKNLGAVVLYSLAVWILVAVADMVLAWGMRGVEQTSLLQAMAIMTLICVFIMIPAAPGYWGLYEAGVIFSLKVLGIQDDESLGAAYALVLHLTQFVPILVVGLIFAVKSQVKVKQIEKKKSEGF